MNSGFFSAIPPQQTTRSMGTPYSRILSMIARAPYAVASMIAALYFAGQQLTPIALIGTTLFVGLGGLSFELARRRASR